MSTPQSAPDSPATRTRVAIVFGGVSSEHSVSCLTAASAASAIDTDRFDVVGIGIAPSGAWSRYSLDEMRAITVVEGQLPVLDAARRPAALLRRGAEVVLADIDGDALGDEVVIDVAMPLLHGPFGEDGTLQGLFEMLGLRYTGAGVMASAVGMDKQVMKLVLVGSGLPVGPFCSITPEQWHRDPAACQETIAGLGFPVYVKPARGGSSVGITKVDSPELVVAAVEAAQKWDPKVVVEKGFENAREIECAVLGGRDGGLPRTSRTGEIRMHTASGFYDFEAKYLPEEQVTLDVPARLDADLEDQVRDVAARTFTACGTEGLARVDVFVTAEGRVVVNEINTMPGFTALSMFPMLWRESGLSYPDVIADLVEQALQRPVGLR